MNCDGTKEPGTEGALPRHRGWTPDTRERGYPRAELRMTGRTPIRLRPC